MLEGIRQAGFSVTVLTRGGFDLEALGRLSGLELKADDVEIVRTSNPLIPGVGALAHGAFIREARRIGREYDLRVSASGVLNWGAPAMHFISSVTWNDALAERFGAESAPSARTPIQRALWGASKRIAGCPPAQGDAKDLFVANSVWTRDVCAPFFQGKSVVLAPPLPFLPSIPEQEREEAVLVLGRISPEKDISATIRIVEAARVAGCSLTLHVLGAVGEDASGKEVREMARTHGDWIKLHGSLFGTAKSDLLARCRYGLSACRVEAFGIATIEMMAAGLVVIAPRSGAQGEAIGEPELLWTDESEATRILVTLGNDPARCAALSDELRIRADRFGPESFVEGVSRLANGFLEGGAIGAKSALDAAQ